MTDLQETVRLERIEPHIALVTLNRPHARNAVNGEVVVRMQEVIRETEADADCRVVVLTGAGTAFCAGADLKAVAAGRMAEVRSPDGFGGFVFAARTHPWIAAVNGPALAGGLELALACEMIVAAEGASFGMPEVKRSLVAGSGGLWRLPRSVPRALAFRMVLTGNPITAQEAERCGLVNACVAAEDLLPTALCLAREIAACAPLAVRESMAVVRAAVLAGERELRDLAWGAVERVKASEDFLEGPRAFIEKRAPRWRGR
ncbi:enoyl-CoA hydratase-related protein [Ramlibacter sp. PS3R-8]|uniref:enoyl-CoA hydratase-related protein n=1 Tax=Ramlibacter sp. PS3R-8 TaxID=3133437 RepID=UPI0030A08D49